MPEDPNTFSPLLFGAIAAVAVICFVIGRLSSAGARKREESLKREVLDVKASVPQLESGIRNRDQQIVPLSNTEVSNSSGSCITSAIRRR